MASPTSAHIIKAESLVKDARQHYGLAPLDLDAFWRDQDEVFANPFSPTIRQLPLNIFHSNEAIFDELGIPEDFWRLEHDEPWRLQLVKAYNDKAEKIIGRRTEMRTANPTRKKSLNMWKQSTRRFHKSTRKQNIINY